MNPPFVLRALAFGLVTSAIVAGTDLLAAALFALATLVGAPVAWFFEQELGVFGWLAIGSLPAIMWTHAER